MFLKDKPKQWYASQVKKQLDDVKRVYKVSIETKLSIKPIHARCIISLYDKFCNSNEMITKASQMVSPTEALSSETRKMNTHVGFYNFFIKIWKMYLK